MDGIDLLRQMRSEQATMVERLRHWVELESPSREKPALDGIAAELSELMASLGGDSRVIPNPDGGNHVWAKFPGPDDVPHGLILGHFDTVWPRGTLETMPFHIEGGRAYGPGAYDMKASLVLIEFAMTALGRAGPRPARPIVCLLTSDEEIGSPTSRPLIEAAAQGAAHALVLEPPLPDGQLKTSRKGVGSFQIEVTGKSSHAGIAPEQGASAILELAARILEVSSLADPSRGTTINLGLVHGGTAPNVVAGFARASVDVRVDRMSEADRVSSALQALTARTPGTSLRVTGSFTRPPMERTAAIAALFERARSLGSNLGRTLAEGGTGGASDGNLTAALGLPTLDGLGALGAGAHADHEHILIESLPERAALLATLLQWL